MEEKQFINTVGIDKMALSSEDWTLNCNKFKDINSAKKDTGSPYHANARQDRKEQATKIQQELSTNLFL